MRGLLAFLVRSSPASALAAVVFGAVGGACGVGLLATIPRALRGDGSGATPALMAGYAGLTLLAVAARVGSQLAMVRLAQGAVARLVRHLSARVLALPLRRFEAMDPGALLALLTEDVAVLAGALAALPNLVVNATVVLGCLAYLGFVSRPVLLATLAFAVPAVLSHEGIARLGRRRLVAARAEHDALAAGVRALVEGFKELKLHRGHRKAFLREAIGDASERVRAGTTSGLAVFALLTGWMQALFFGYLGLLLFVLPGVVDVSPEARAAGVLTVVFAFAPLDMLLNALPVFARAAASMARIEAAGITLGASAVDDPAELPASPGPLRGPVVLRGLTYSYPGESGGEGFHLGPVGLTVRPGETLFLVGGNGSGKTTLLKLLTGLYPPDSGEIVCEGRPVTPEGLDDYRQKFSVVFADGFLFPKLPNVDLDGRAGDWLDTLGLKGKVRVERGAFSTTDLSVGQRKRLALLAACLDDRPVLVLDEWASHQDPPFKKAFYLEILPALKASGKTLVVISHDEAFFDAADRVVHLTEGVVVDAEAVDLVASSLVSDQKYSGAPEVAPTEKCPEWVRL